MKPVTVTYNATAGSLSIDEAETSLELTETMSAIHSLVWKFEGIEGLVAAGWAPGIDFLLPENSNEEGVYLGPFTDLCTTDAVVVAAGNTGQADAFSYRAVLRPPGQTGLKITSEPASLVNRMAKAPAAIVVTREGSDPDANPALTLQPSDVTLWPGQSMTWEVMDPGLDDEWLPRIVFHEGPEYAFISSHFGPFATIETRKNGLLASGNRNQPGLYKYAFQMVSAEDGQVLIESTGDPTIDDQGDPPDTGAIRTP